MIRLEVIDGKSQGRIFTLAENVCFVGRAPANDVVLDDSHVSGRHARIVQGLQAATIEDLGSTNGTAVLREGNRIGLDGIGDAVELRTGDVLELGREDEICRLRVTLVEEERPPHLVSVKKVDEPPEVPDDPLTVRALYDAQSKIGRASDLDDVLEAIADGAFDLLPHATHVTIVLSSGEAKSRSATYLPVLTRARPAGRGAISSDGKNVFVPVTRSVYRKVLAERSAVLAADAPKEVGTAPSLMAASVRSTIAVPLWQDKEILGVLQVDNRDAPGMLKPRDLDV
ncbi:MAG TPA: FHA domain-containing protein, partial [Polyangiaceae bacterium]|nr:FHA domain-containing protein [Polyangiaceae bacterium]